MKRKLLFVLLACVSLALAAAAFAGCKEEKPAGETAHTHELIYHEAKEATCTQDGNTEYWQCEGCGKYFADADGEKEIDEKGFLIEGGHDLFLHEAKEATCTQDGNTEYWECSVCGKYFADGYANDALSDLSSVTVAAHHSLTYYGEKQPSCTQDGNIAYWACSVCGLFFEDEEGKTELEGSVVLPAHHDLVHYDAVPETCTEGGNIEYWQCKNCYALFSDAEGKTAIGTAEIPAAGHKTQFVAEKPASCTQTGVKGHYHCDRCGGDFWDGDGGSAVGSQEELVIAATGHRNIYGVRRKEPTCTEQGNREYWACPDCGGYFADAKGEEALSAEELVLDAKTHKLIHYPARESTCTQGGNIEYWQCEYCSAVFSDEAGKEPLQGSQYLPLKEHDFTDVWCKDENFHWYECTVCGYKKEEDSHNWNGAAESACTVCGYALGYTYGLTFKLNEEGTAYSVTGGPSLAEVSVPAEYKGLPVTAIADHAFENHTSLTGIVIPETVLSVGDGAFRNCTALREIVLPAGVREVSVWAFTGCTNLTKASVSAEAARGVAVGSVKEIEIIGGTAIAENAFNGATALQKLTLCASVQTVGAGAFRDCSSLQEVCIGDLSAWCSICFADENANPLHSGATLYQNGEAVTALSVPADVKTIGDYAFCGYTKLTSLTLPAGLKEIGQGAFCGCTQLSGVAVPASVQTVKSRAFDGCSGAETIAFAEGVQAIAPDALINCSSLKEIVIPDSAVCDGTLSFTGCTALESVTIGDGIASVGGLSAKEHLREVILGDGIEKVYDAMFQSCTALERVTLGANVGEIGVSAFNGCAALQEIDIPSNVTGIGNYAFQECTSLKMLSVPGRVAKIGDSAFSGCTALWEVYLSEGVREIGNSAFLGCSALTDIAFPSTLLALGKSAFSNCSVLKEVSFDEEGLLEAIPDFCFSECSALEKLSFGKNIRSIETAFNDCGGFIIDYRAAVGEWCSIDGLKELMGPIASSYEQGERVLYIGGKEIEGEITVSGTETIGAYAFYGCDLITKVVIEDTVTSIGARAFYGCSSMKQIFIPQNVTSVGENAFAECAALTVYCEAGEKPDGWAENWIPDDRPVEWGAVFGDTQKTARLRAAL